MVCIVAFQKVSAYVNLLLSALVLVEVQVSYCERKQWNNGLKSDVTVAVRRSSRIVVARTCVRLVTNGILIPDVIGNTLSKNRKEGKRWSIITGNELTF